MNATCLFRIGAVLASLCAPLLRAGHVTIHGQTAGPTPFIKLLNLTVSDASALDHIDFKIYPKPTSGTRPVYARYSKAYLQERGLLEAATGNISLPVFGLYADYINRVALVSTFLDQTSQRDEIHVATPVWNDTTNLYKNPVVAQARKPNTDLSYDFMLIRHYSGNNMPLIMDTDGEIRWAGTSGDKSGSALYFDGAIYIYSGTTIVRMELDGTRSSIVNLASQGVTNFHHNFDPGRTGILVETDTIHATDPNLNQIGSTIFEIGAGGAILKRWNLAKTLRDAITEGNQDVFVRNRGQTNQDWFHSNSAAYRPSDNTLIVSSRENFVVAVDYDTGVLKWLMGDTTKQWYQGFPSLRPYALAIGQDVVPMGQHSVDIRRDRLSLFDNGEHSYHHTPPGVNRNYSAPRKYLINAAAKTATLIWQYAPTPSIDANICSSVYEDASRNRLVNYAVNVYLIGLDSSGERVFDYRYSNSGLSCYTMGNCIPIHLENLRFE